MPKKPQSLAEKLTEALEADHSKDRSKQSLNGAKPTPAAMKTVSLLVDLLSDGKPHDSQDVKDYLKANGSGRKFLPWARKRVGATVSKVANGKAVYQLIGVKESNKFPQLSKSSELLQEQAGDHASTVREKLDAVGMAGYDPVVALAQIGSDLSVPLAVRLEIHQTLLKYMVPQVKAADISTTDQPIGLKFEWGTENDDKGREKLMPRTLKKMMN